MDFSYVHIRYFIGYVYHICLQDTIQSTLSLCLRCQAMLLPMPLRPLLLTTRSGFNGKKHKILRDIIQRNLREFGWLEACMTSEWCCAPFVWLNRPQQTRIPLMVGAWWLIFVI